MDNFNWKSYIQNYSDLRHLTSRQDALKHYIKFGQKEGRTDQFTYKSHPYYTHQPFLIEILKNTTGNVLECGCGYGSTVCIKDNIGDRKLITLESNKEWLDKFRSFESENHKLYHIPASNDDTLETGQVWVDFIEQNITDDFDIVFIDSSPWLSRKKLFDYFKDRAKIIIIHDFDYFPNNNIIGSVTSKIIKGSFTKIGINMDSEISNYKLYYPPFEFFASETGPPTLVCSNTIDDFNELINIIDTNLKKYY